MHAFLTPESYPEGSRRDVLHPHRQQVFPLHRHLGDQSHKTYQDRGFQKPQARLFMSFLSIFNPPSQNSLYLSNFSKISKHFKFHKAQAMFILLVKCWRSQRLYCVLNLAPRCWRVAPGFIRIADPFQEVTPKAWRTWFHMGITQVGHCKGHLRVQWCG